MHKTMRDGDRKKETTGFFCVKMLICCINYRGYLASNEVRGWLCSVNKKEVGKEVVVTYLKAYFRLQGLDWNQSRVLIAPMCYHAV